MKVARQERLAVPFVMGLLLFVVHFAMRLNMFKGFPIHPHGDGYDYQRLANQIVERGDFFEPSRLPGYPLFALLMNRFQTIDFDRDFAQLIMGNNLVASLAVAVFFGIFYMATRQLLFAAVVSFVFFFHAAWFCFEGTFLTETLTIFCLLLHGAAVFAFLKEPGERRNVAGVFVSMIALILVKPTYVLFWMLTWAGVTGILAFKRPKGWRGQAVQATVWAALITLMLHTFSSVNAKRHGFYGVTDVGSINMFMRPVTLDLDKESLLPEHINTLPPEMREISEVFAEMDRQGVNRGLASRVIAYLRDHRPDLLENGYARLAGWGKYLITHHKASFVKGSLEEMLAITDGYDYSLSPLSKLHERWFTPGYHYIADSLRPFSENLSWIIVFNLITLVVFLPRERALFWLLSYLWLIAVYTIGISSFGSFSIGARAKVPVEPLVALQAGVTLGYMAKVLLGEGRRLVALLMTRVRGHSHRPA